MTSLNNAEFAMKAIKQAIKDNDWQAVADAAKFLGMAAKDLERQAKGK